MHDKTKVGFRQTAPPVFMPEDMIYTARVLAWPDCVVTGKTRDEVITRIRHKIVKRLAQSEIVTIEIEPAILERMAA
jgi:predicted RNase H-like HicB family nuclease